MKQIYLLIFFFTLIIKAEAFPSVTIPFSYSISIFEEFKPFEPLKPKKAKRKKEKRKNKPQWLGIENIFWWFFGLLLLTGSLSILGWSLLEFITGLLSVGRGNWILGAIMGSLAVLLLIGWMIYGLYLDIDVSIFLGVLAFWAISMFGIAMLIAGISMGSLGLWLSGLILAISMITGALLFAYFLAQETNDDFIYIAIAITVLLTLLAFLIGGLLARLLAFWLPSLIILGLLLLIVFIVAISE